MSSVSNHPQAGISLAAGAALTSRLVHGVHGMDEEQGVGLRVLHKHQQELQRHLHHQAELGRGTAAVAGRCQHGVAVPVPQGWWLHHQLWGQVTVLWGQGPTAGILMSYGH